MKIKSILKKEKDSYSKIFGASVIALFMLVTAFVVTTVIAIDLDETPPIQNIELGNPLIPDVYNLGGDWIDLIGAHTPVWINSSDPESDVTWVNYTLYWSDEDPTGPGWDTDITYHVKDNFNNGNPFESDTNEEIGVICINISFDISCFHEIHAWCENEYGYGLWTKLDFLVDADGPSNEDFDYIGHYLTIDHVRYINNETIKRINATDTGCVAGVAGVCRIEWKVEQWTDTVIDEAEGIVFDNQEEWYEDDLCIVSNDTDKSVGNISINISLKKSCTHYIYHTAFDCLENSQNGKKELNRVDVDPPVTTKTHPEGHGFVPIYEDEPEQIVLDFEDVPLANPWSDNNPIPDGYGGLDWDLMYVLHGYNYAPGSGYDTGSVSGDWVAFNAWAQVATVSDDFFNFEGAYFTSAWNDTLNISIIGYRDDVEIYNTVIVAYYDTATWFDLNFLGVDKIVFESWGGTDADPLDGGIGAHFAMDDFTYSISKAIGGYIKPFMPITFTIEDKPDNECKTGFEAFFYRYTWNGTYYPHEGYSSPITIVNGSELATTYGYDDPDIINYWWFRIDDTYAEVIFEEECQHDIYYWSKDNIWNKEKIHHQTYYVDDTPPEIELLNPEDHGYVKIGDIDYLKCFTPVTLKAEDVGLGVSYTVRDPEILEAIDKGLAWLASQQKSDGSLVTYHNNNISGTAFAILKWCEHAKRFNKTDPFDPTYQYYNNIMKGLEFLFDKANTISIHEQTYGDPDDGDGIGVYFYSPLGYVRPGYETPIVLLAFASTGHPEYVLPNGPLSGWTLGDVVQDMVDWIAFAQQDSGWGRGGWRYVAWDNGSVYGPGDTHTGADNSVSQWPALALIEASLHPWNIDAPQFVKDELAIWLDYTQQTVSEGGSGGFGYSSSGSPDHDMTAAGMIQLTYIGKTLSDEEMQDARDWIGANWNSGENLGYMYSLYAVMKAAMIAQPGPITHFGAYDWGQIYDDYLLANQVLPDGYWTDEYGTVLGTEWALLVLQRIAPEITTQCAAGVESIFWRYEYDGEEYPEYLDTHGFPIITGDELFQLYEYEDPELVDYWWYKIDSDEAEVLFKEQCVHKLYYWTKDNVSNHGPVFNYTYYVDDTPPESGIIVPDHGYYYNETTCKHYLKTNKHFKIYAYDDHECASGVESIFWRYEWKEGEFPEDMDTHEFPIITGQELFEKYGYQESWITDYWWYQINDVEADIWFEEQCEHRLYWFTKDNVSNHGPEYFIKFYVDDTAPDVWLGLPPQGQGYIYDEKTDKDYIQCGVKVWINAEDVHECAAGLESIFWRYEFDGNDYPKDGDTYGFPIVTGAELTMLYGYVDPDIVNHHWYRIDDKKAADVWFNENCTHKLYYWAKDNVCNRTEIYNKTFYVDCAPPESIKTIGEPKWWDDDQGLWWVTSETPFSITAQDTIAPCAVGVDYLYVKVEHSCDNISYSTYFEVTIYDNEIGDENLDEGIIVFNFTLGADECWYRITWYAADKLGHVEEVHVQYHLVDNTPPHAVILKPSDGWYTDGSAIPSVVLSKDLPSIHGGCGPNEDCVVGIEDGAQAKAFLFDIFPELKCVELDTTNFKYDIDSNEYIGNMVIPDPSGIPDGVVLLVVLSEDRLGNNWTTLMEAIHIAIIQALVECVDECCVLEVLTDILADFIIDQNIVFLGIDNTPPEVTIIEPENGDDVGLGPIDMEVEAVDVLSGINLGAQMHVTLADINIGTLLYNDATDQWEGSLSIPMEVPGGTHELTASIADIAGCTGSDTILVSVADRPGPTTSGTDVQPDPSLITILGEGEDLTITATIHSTIAFVEGAEYFINDTKPDESEWGLGTPLSPVDGDWGETTEDVTAMFNTDDWDPGVYICWVHGIDNNGRWGAFDEEEFNVVLETHWRPIFVRIMEPDDDDGYDTYEVEQCDDRYITVVVDAHYWDDPFYEDLDDIDVSIWLDDPYGAPDQFYEVYQMDNYFYADIPIYWYSSGSTLNIWAKAEDDYYNKEYDDSKFDVITTVEFDMWLEKGWNGPINLAVNGCDNSTVAIFSSIDPYWDYVFEVGTWDNYWYNQAEEWMNGGPLQKIDRDSWYWIHLTESARFFIDNNPPLVEILYPIDELTYWNDQCLDGFEGWACDIETGIKDVKLVIFDNVEEEYWNGTNWVSTYTELECDYDDGDYEWYCADSEDIELTYKSGHEIFVTAIATDMAGCEAEHTIWFMFIDEISPEIDIEYPEEGATYECGNPGEIVGTAYDEECETIVVEVFIQIEDDYGKYWDGDSWETDPTNLSCIYSSDTTDWFYNGDLPSWQSMEEYMIHAFAKDAADNIGDDSIYFYYICQEGECDPDKTWTTDEDFEEGDMLGTYAEDDSLKLETEGATTYPTLWIANAGEDSLSKWDTSTNEEVARYHTWFGELGDHGAWDGPAPSRTCVDSDGNCYVANRHFDGLPTDVIKVLTDDWIDRNGDGFLNTSYDEDGNGEIEPDEMLPMTDTNGNNIIDDDEIVDERIAWATAVGEAGDLGRSIAIDLEGNIWVGTYYGYEYYKLDKDTGDVIGGPYPVGNTPYGALVDKHGILWGSSLGNSLLKLNTSNPADTTTFYVPNTYGIALGYDSLDNTIVYCGGNDPFVIFNSSTETYSYPDYFDYALGVAVDSQGYVVAGSYYDGSVAKYTADGSKVWEVVGQDVSEIRGIVVDSDDNIWAVHREASKLCKYDGTDGTGLGVFNSGLSPYTYSDATGIGYSGSVNTGKWTAIHDSQAAGTIWNSVSWNSDEPEGTSITVKVRSSEDALIWSPWEETNSGDPLSETPDGRYVQIQVTMQSDSDVSPILYDISVDGTCVGGEELGSISGTVYYNDCEGENSGDVLIGLFNETLAEDSEPIDSFTIPEGEQGCPIIGHYEFTGLEDDTYWVMGFMDTNDDDTPSAYEPNGFAVNKSTWPDYIEISGANDEIGKDITLFDPEPSIDLEKYVWDSDSGDWAEETVVDQGDNVRFNISIHIDGIAAPLMMDEICDYLPSGFEYIDDSTEIWLVTHDVTHYYNDINPDEEYGGYWVLTWDISDWVLFPCNWIYLEFEATASECDDIDAFENVADVVSYYDDLEIFDDDNAFVWIYCDCEAAMEIDKNVWCPINKQWYEAKSVEDGETVRFNITFDSDGYGVCDLSQIKIRDYMEDVLTYANEMTVDHPDTITSYNFEISGDGMELYWNFTGYLEPGAHIFIEFNATVNWAYECDYAYNFAYARAYSEWEDKELDEVNEDVYLWEVC